MRRYRKTAYYSNFQRGFSDGMLSVFDLFGLSYRRNLRRLLKETVPERSARAIGGYWESVESDLQSAITKYELEHGGSASEPKAKEAIAT